tara:strand:+ start:383 stop:502 length:120 start_codon:yes stop_codon:yes gene_type:complete
LTYSNNCSKDKDKYYGIDPDRIPEPEEALIEPNEENKED